jgi:hypothetical protein
MIKFNHKGDFNKTLKFLAKSKNLSIPQILEKYGQEGVRALAANTPVDSHLTANSWNFEIQTQGDRYRIFWTNSNVQNGVSIAIILQYGHGTRTGGYVEGRDYINPAIRPIFDRIAEAAWQEVTNG